MDGLSLHPRGGRRPLAAVAVLACVCSLGILTSLGAATGRADDDAAAVPGQLVVGFKPNFSGRQQQKAIDKVGATIANRIDSIGGAVVNVDPAETEAAAEELAHQRAVQYVEPNYVLQASRLPNDRGFGEQWGLRNTGQYGGSPGADVHATEAWDVTTGGGVIVAVVDTGVATDHPDLAPNMWTNPADPKNGVDDDGNGLVDDVHGADFLGEDGTPDDDAGHGTHVAGILGAEGNNATGVAGVDWESRIMALKFLDGDGEGNTADAANAIDYAVNHGARVINASWGGPAFSQALFQAVKRAGERGVLFVAAAGNDGQNADSSPDFPAAFELPNVISVAASDRSDKLLEFSNYGAHSVDLAAPGDDIYSTVPSFSDSSGYESFSGTSMATPFVTGGASLYLSRAPQATPDQVKAALLQSVDQSPAFAGKVASGGRLNIGRAIGALAPKTAPEPDKTAPTPFALLRPHNRHLAKKRSLRFVWQRSRDVTGIKVYKLYMNGRPVKTVRDPDGPGGRDPKPRARARLRGGRHRWFVRAFDYFGNHRTSRSFRHGRSSKSSVLFVRKRHAKRVVAHLAWRLPVLP
jgi:subtilisin family serine protease